MHKILKEITRISGSVVASGNLIVSSQPATEIAVDSGAKLPIRYRTYDLACLTAEERADIEQSNDLKAKIEAKGYTYTKVFIPNTFQVLTGFVVPMSPEDFQQTSVKLLQSISSMYLEKIFGYWYVYEMDFEKLYTQKGIAMNMTLQLYGYEGFTLKRLLITETAGVSGGMLYVMDALDNLITSVEVVANMSVDVEVNVPFAEDVRLKVVCDNWNDAKVDISAKHVETE